MVYPAMANDFAANLAMSVFVQSVGASGSCVDHDARMSLQLTWALFSAFCVKGGMAPTYGSSGSAGVKLTVALRLFLVLSASAAAEGGLAGTAGLERGSTGHDRR